MTPQYFQLMKLMKGFQQKVERFHTLKKIYIYIFKYVKMSKEMKKIALAECNMQMKTFHLI